MCVYECDVTVLQYIPGLTFGSVYGYFGDMWDSPNILTEIATTDYEISKKLQKISTYSL